MAELPPLSLAQCITLACSWEVCIPKVGNVHRSADFADTTLYDFVTSSTLMAAALANAGELGVGPSILQAVTASRRATQGNTHLGTILLLGPLCAVPRGMRLDQGIPAVLASLTEQDATDVYAAIRLSQAGGLGRPAQGDVYAGPPPRLIDAMQLAADRDRIARQFTTEFHDVLQIVAPHLAQSIQAWGLVPGVIATQLSLMSRWPDSLIARKCGPELASESAVRAQRVLDTQDSRGQCSEDALADFDFWLRADGNRRNPGTTADLIAAGLFCILRENRMTTFAYSS